MWLMNMKKLFIVMLCDKTPLENSNWGQLLCHTWELYGSDGTGFNDSKTIYLLAEYFVGVPSGFSAVVSLAEGGGGMANAVVCCAAPPVALFVDDGWFTITSSSLSS